jgi:hypothetical protein
MTLRRTSIGSSGVLGTSGRLQGQERPGSVSICTTLSRGSGPPGRGGFTVVVAVGSPHATAMDRVATSAQ